MFLIIEWKQAGQKRKKQPNSAGTGIFKYFFEAKDRKGPCGTIILDRASFCRLPR
jgi:hypothetical protein